MADSSEPISKPADGARTGRAGLWLVVAVAVTMLVADWFLGSLTQRLVLGEATVSITSQPAGAMVLADTLELGVTPLVKGKLLPGTYVLRVEHPHFEPVRETINVARGDAVNRAVQLVRGAGTLVLVSNPRGATISLNGVLRDELTPATLEAVAAGIYEIELALPGRKSALASIDVQRGQAAKLSADLNRVPTGVLSLEVVPANAAIELMGVTTPYTADMSLPLGDYQVRVSRPGFATEQQNILLRRGPNRLSFVLQRHSGELTVNVTPASALVTVQADGNSQRYSGPMQLPTGKVRVSASKLGFRAQSKTLELVAGGMQITLNLARFDVTPGRAFSDPLRSGGQGPEVVVVGAGAFQMGDTAGAGAADEQPVHRVQLQVPFAIGRREVSRAEWQRQFGDIDNQLPMTNVSREQIAQYLGWLSAQTGSRYRLPTEAEWEYAARAGGDARFGATNSAADLCRYGNVADATLKTTYNDWQSVSCDDAYVQLAPVGSFAPNAFGLFDTIGNASEWVADCWHSDYQGAPDDGRAWGENCASWVARGGAWDNDADSVRVSFRAPAGRKNSKRGFRILREL